MKIIVTDHAKSRLLNQRQKGVEVSDIVKAASSLPGKLPKATRFRGFISKEKRTFDIVIKDIEIGRLVITVIGK